MPSLNRNNLKHIYQEGIYLTPGHEKSDHADNKYIESKPFNFIGENGKNILILNFGEKDEVMNKNELAFLTKILQSVQLTLADVAVLRWDDSYHLSALQDGFKFQTFICLNQIPDCLQSILSSERYQIQNSSSVQYLFIDSLKEIEADVEKKKLLWKCLKTLFNG